MKLESNYIVANPKMYYVINTFALLKSYELILLTKIPFLFQITCLFVELRDKKVERKSLTLSFQPYVVNSVPYIVMMHEREDMARIDKVSKKDKNSTCNAGS